MRTFFSILLIALFSSVAAAGDGMWLPSQLPAIADRLEAAGLETDPNRFADLTGHPMGAIVSLGGCSASFVSPEGLVATNHHCAYGSIQFNSTEDNNLLENGFLAASTSDELPASPGARIYVTLAVEDVTSKILAAIPKDADGATRYSAIEDAEKRLIAACEETPGHRCKVASFHGGETYRLYDQLEIRDVRLVYAPPSSVGKYGGDIDNWMWPRHTGDFAFYRAWVGPDGQPADRADDNIPFKPKHWLEIGTDGVEKDDYVMVVGFPGRTNRYRLASEVEEAITWTYPQRVERRAASLEIIARETEGRPDAALAYAATSSYLNNSLKNAQGMVAGFARSDSVERKKALEAELAEWIDADPDRNMKWATALSDLESILEAKRANRERDQELSSLRWNQLIAAANTAYRLAREREKPDVERKMGYQERDLRRIKARIMRSARSFDAMVDMALLQHTLESYAALPAKDHLAAIDSWFGLDDATDPSEAIASTLHRMYMATDLTDVKARLALLEADRAALEASDDPFVQFAVAMYDTTIELETEDDDLSGQLLEARPRFMEALLAFQRARGLEIYPDANSTLRVTFGNVQGYQPRDAVWYTPFTTAEGIAEKATGEEPFDASAEQLEAIADADYGPYASEQVGSLPVNFLSDVDTTGGNSGSATLDSQGRLVGLLFDGNWESMISDWDFLPEVTRSIHADVRYMLWIMDRIDGAHKLLEEMGVEPAFGSAP
jgi:hypothetical protein